MYDNLRNNQPTSPFSIINRAVHFGVKSLREKEAALHARTTFWNWLAAIGNRSASLALDKLAESLLQEGADIDPVLGNMKAALTESENALRRVPDWGEVQKDIAARADVYQGRITAQFQSGAPASASTPPKNVQPETRPSISIKETDRSLSTSLQTTSLQRAEAPSSSSRMWEWVTPGKEINIRGFRITGGLVYTGSSPAPYSGGGKEASLLDPKLPVQTSAADCRIRRTNYWPSYESISPEARASYLLWLSTGKSNPEADIGYVFLYFYGLERRVLIDGAKDPAAKAELPAIEAEIVRLLGIYQGNGSFNSYASSLLEYIQAAQGIKALTESLHQGGTRGLGLALRISLGSLASKGEPITPLLAWAWFLQDPGIRRPNLMTRCSKVFAEAFQTEVVRRFPEGWSLKPGKTKLKISHRPASASLNGSVHSIELDLPDVSVLGSSIQKLQGIGDTVAASLEPYSRYLGRNPGNENTLDAILLLPKHLWPRPVQEPFETLAKEVAATNRPVTMPFVNLQLLLPEGSEFNKTRYGALCRAMAAAGLGIEPDVEYGGEVPDLKDPVVLFRLQQEGATGAPSRAFPGASLLVHLAAAVAGADGAFGEAEADLLLNHINHGLDLPPAETLRLHARVDLFRKKPPSITGLKRRVESLPLDARKAIGDFLVHVVLADGVVDPGEVRSLEKAFKLLGLEQANLYSHLHGAASQPVTVRPATETGPTYRIPSPAPPPQVQPTSGLKLDMAKVAALKEDSAKVAALLGAIFTETAPVESAPLPEPEIAAGPEGLTATLLGLDPEHEGLLRAILVRPQWTRAELEEVCADRGLMVDGAIERINEAAFERYDMPLIEGEDPLDINLELTLEEAQ